MIFWPFSYSSRQTMRIEERVGFIVRYDKKIKNKIKASITRASAHLGKLLDMPEIRARRVARREM